MKNGYEEREGDSSEGDSPTFWKLNCLCGEEADAPENYLQGFNTQVKLVLKFLQSFQVILMFI